MKLIVHCDQVPFDVFIGRGSKWGNPFSHIPDSRALWITATRHEAIERYGAWIMEQDDLLRQIKNLKGKVLGCYCDPLPCHGHILAALANENYEFNIGTFQAY